MRTIQLGTPHLLVSIDPGRGADVVSLVDRRTGIDVLFSSPWRARADAIREGQAPSTSDSVAGWLEQYRGGWQTLCPVAGAPRNVNGGPVGFHGEASVVPWTVEEVRNDTARAHVDLFSVPLRISRVITLREAKISIVDTLINLSSVPLEFDYSHHPAFGGAFLDGSCRIDTGARRLTIDPETTSVLPPGSEHDWPWALDGAGARVDLREIPGPGSPSAVFGWLHDFADYWASITNIDLGLAVRIEWDGEHLPYAWLWEELNSSELFPWYRRARVIAIEPASVQTSGAGRRSALRLGPEASVQVAISIALHAVSG